MSNVQTANRELVERIAVLSARADVDDDLFFTLPTNESITVALVLDRLDMLGGRTALEAIQSIGPDALRAALIVQKGRR